MVSRFICGVNRSAVVWVSSVAADTSLPIKAIILLTPWDTLGSLAQTIYWYLPARWMVLDKYDSIKNLRSFQGRIAVLIAEQDNIIPKRHGLTLYDSITTDKKLWTFAGAGHNSWPKAADETMVAAGDGLCFCRNGLKN